MQLSKYFKKNYLTKLRIFRKSCPSPVEMLFRGLNFFLEFSGESYF